MNDKFGEWIPVSERLPEEEDSFLTGEHVFKKNSEEVIVTIVRGKEKFVSTAMTLDGKWMSEYLIKNAQAKVVAWMPLPEPYRESEV